MKAAAIFFAFAFWCLGLIPAAAQGPSQVFTIPTVAALRGLPATFGVTTSNVYLSGYYAAGDGQGCRNLRYNAASSATDNGGTVFKQSAVSGSGRWECVYTPTIIYMSWFGVKTTGSSADAAFNTAALRAAVGLLVNSSTSACATQGGTIILPAGTIAVSDYNSSGKVISINMDAGLSTPCRVTIEGQGYDATVIQSETSGASVVPVIWCRGGATIFSACDLKAATIQSDPSLSPVGGGQQNGGYAVQLEATTGSHVDLHVNNMQRAVYLYNQGADRFDELTEIKGLFVNNYQAIVFNVGTGTTSFNRTSIDGSIDVHDGQSGFVGLNAANIYAPYFNIKLWSSGTTTPINLSGGAIVQLGYSNITFENFGGTATLTAGSGSYWLTDGGFYPLSPGAVIFSDAPITADFGWGPESLAGQFMFNRKFPVRSPYEDLGTTYEHFRNVYFDGIQQTFTPLLTFGGGSTGLSYAVGRDTGVCYTIGPLVQCTIDIVLTAKGSSTGDVSISGLPVTSANVFAPTVGSAVSQANMTSNIVGPVVIVQPNATTLTLLVNGTQTKATEGNFSDTSQLELGFTYRLR